jgi:hypothetical protein
MRLRQRLPMSLWTTHDAAPRPLDYVWSALDHSVVLIQERTPSLILCRARSGLAAPLHRRGYSAPVSGGSKGVDCIWAVTLRDVPLCTKEMALAVVRG